MPYSSTCKSRKITNMIIAYIITNHILAIPHHMTPCKNKLDVLYFVYAIFTWLGLTRQNRSNLRKNHNGDIIVAYLLILLKGLPLKIATSLEQEKQTPASHLCNTSCMSVVEPVSRVWTIKVGPGRFNPTIPSRYKVHVTR